MNRHPTRMVIQQQLREERDEVAEAREVRIPSNFGKYGGRRLGHVVDTDPGYIDILYGFQLRKAEFRDAVRVLRLAYASAIADAKRSQEHLR